MVANFCFQIFHDLSGLEVLSHWTLFPGNLGGADAAQELTVASTSAKRESRMGRKMRARSAGSSGVRGRGPRP